MANLPDFKDLPHLPGLPEFTGCAWGLWGKEDQLGTVNLLTPEVVKEAAKEIQTGKSVALNWDFHLPTTPSFHRQGLTHKIIEVVPGAAVRDEVITINSQAGTQWGLRHFGILKTGQFYNGVDAAKEVVVGEFNAEKATPADTKLGIHNLAIHGVSGRGVLLDIVRFYEKTGRKPIDPLTSTPIPVKDLEECAKFEGVTFRNGDILLLRVGFVKAYATLSAEIKSTALEEKFAGVEQGEEMKEFLWNNHFAAVGSDQPSFERWPPTAPEGAPFAEYLHETLLGLWGCPIGEMFDLEALSHLCEEQNRWTFFFTSWPLKIIGGVASPPNAAAYL